MSRNAKRCLFVGVIALLGAAAPAGAFTGPIVVKSGLNNPRGMNFGADGSLFVAEAGRAGTRCTRSVCAGATGAIARLQGDRLTRFFEGLVSVGPRGGVGVTGPSDVGIAIVSGRVYVVVGDGGVRPPRGFSSSLARQLGRLLRVGATSATSIEILAGLSAFEQANNPDRGARRSDPSGVAIDGMQRWITDASANTLLLERDGVVSLGAVLPRSAGRAASPAAVRMGPDGALYVGEFRTGAKVWRVVPGQPPTVFARGFTRIAGLSFGPDGSLYVAEHGSSRRGAAPRGAIIRLRPGGGARETIGRGRLRLPGGIAVRSDGVIFASNYSNRPGRPVARGPFPRRTGQIVRFNP
jgi:hypothetical protein